MAEVVAVADIEGSEEPWGRDDPGRWRSPRVMADDKGDLGLDAMVSV